MSYSFRVTIGGVTYTEADFVGMAYLQGVPDSLDALAQVALQENVGTSSTPFTPSSAGSQTVVLDDSRIDFPVGSVVGLRCVGDCLQIGQVTSWDPVTRALTFQKKYHQPGTSTPPWAVFPATGPAGLGGGWGSRPRAIDEGGYGGSNGMVQRFSPDRGYRVEGVGIPRPDVGFPLSWQRDGWIVTRSSSEIGPGFLGFRVYGSGASHAIRATPLRTSGRGIIHVGWCHNLADTGTLNATCEILITSPDGEYHVGMVITQEGATTTYSVVAVREGQVVTHSLPFSQVAGTLTFVMGGYGGGGSGVIQVFSSETLDTPTYTTPVITLDVPDSVISLVVRAKSTGGGDSRTALQIPYYSITEPLPLR